MSKFYKKYHLLYIVYEFITFLWQSFYLFLVLEEWRSLSLYFYYIKFFLKTINCLK
jgi:hypothetical protein